jgi:hypothetical protein
MFVRPHGTNSTPSGRIVMELDIWALPENMSRKFKFNSKSDKNKGYFTWRPMYVRDTYWILFRMRNISGKGLEKITCLFCVQWLFPANGFVYEIVCKNLVWAEQAIHDNIKWRLRFAGRITKARTHTHTHTHTQNILYYDYVNAPQCYVIRTCPLLFYYPVFVFHISKYDIKIMFTDKRKYRGSWHHSYISPVLPVTEGSAEPKFGTETQWYRIAGR